MKRVVLFLFLMLGVAGAMAQDFYTIQVRSLSRETPLTVDELEAGMWQHKVGKQTKCFMGRYDTYAEAKEALEPLKSSYQGAFVVSSKKIFTVGGEGNIKELNTSQAAPDMPPPPPPAPAGSKHAIQIYTIQIAAYRFPLYTKDFNLDSEVMEFYCKDNIYRYSVGKVKDEAEARILLNKIKESGYPDAFLIDYKKYEVFRIE